MAPVTAANPLLVSARAKLLWHQWLEAIQQLPLVPAAGPTGFMEMENATYCDSALVCALTLHWTDFTGCL